MLFLQLWPFYYSEHGAHLEEWIEGFAHLRLSGDEVAGTVRSQSGDPGWVEYKLGEFSTLNRIRLDELSAHVLSAGFRIARAELISHAIRPSIEQQSVPL
jgi:hypothetical protein